MPPPIDSHSHRSPNYDERPGDIRAVVMHTGEGTKASDLSWLCNPSSGVSAHYYVDRSGALYELVDPHKQAWHAGRTLYAGLRDWNAFSIGVEAEHKAGQDWPGVQRRAYKVLIEYLMGRFNIANGFIVPHRWIAVDRLDRRGRKADPTDWPDVDLKPWIADLRPASMDPLKARQLLGLRGMHFCGVGFFNFYHNLGGLNFFGYPLADEQMATGTDGRACTYMSCERVVLKYVEGVGPHLALLSEAAAKGWISGEAG